MRMKKWLALIAGPLLALYGGTIALKQWTPVDVYFRISPPLSLRLNDAEDAIDPWMAEPRSLIAGIVQSQRIGGMKMTARWGNNTFAKRYSFLLLSTDVEPLWVIPSVYACRVYKPFWVTEREIAQELEMKFRTSDKMIAHGNHAYSRLSDSDAAKEREGFFKSRGR